MGKCAASHVEMYPGNLSLHHQKNATMNITLNIQNILTVLFVVLIFAPFPILLLSAPLGYVKNWIRFSYYYRVIKRHHPEPQLLNMEQLKKIFPNKGIEELEEIAYSLDERKTQFSYKF